MKFVDPVCEKTVLPWWASIRGLHSELGCKNYHFCSHQCKARFDEHPTDYTMAEDEWRATDDGMPGAAPENRDGMC